MDLLKTVWPEFPEIDGVQFGLAQMAEADAIGRLSRELVESGLSSWSWNPYRIASYIQHSDALVMVGRDNGRLVAAAIMEFADSESHLNLLVVKPQYQRLGIGKCMVRFIENSAYLFGHAVVRLEVRLKNEAARAFYRSLGYQEVKVIENYYSGKEAAVFLAHQLKPHPTTQAMKKQKPD